MRLSARARFLSRLVGRHLIPLTHTTTTLQGLRYDKRDFQQDIGAHLPGEYAGFSFSVR